MEDFNVRGRLIKFLMKGLGLIEIMGKYFDPNKKIVY
jgi:hypothetical protein